MSDRAYFHEIEAHLAFELGSFIAACLPQEETKRLEEIRSHDRRPPDTADVLDWELSDLIGFFTRPSFFDIAVQRPRRTPVADPTPEDAPHL